MPTDNPEYDAWAADRTPENMAAVLDKLDPAIVSEIQRYQGPRNTLHTQARQLAVKAVQSYDPSRGASLRTWTTVQLQPLSRYSAHLKSIRVPEEAARQSAELHRISLEWQDQNGRLPNDDELSDAAHMPADRIRRIRGQSRPAMSESQLMQAAESESGDVMPGVSTHNVPALASEGVYKDLDPREQLIFDWKTGSHGKGRLENQEIASRLKVTPALITQITQKLAKRIAEVSRGI